MKTFILLFLFAFIGWSSFVFAQSPQLINYQAVARNTGGQLIINQNISVRISILSGSATGTVEYSETHAVTTNQFGIFNIQIGAGIVVSGIFAQISWSSADHFVKVEADETGGTNYQLLGTSQLISVPYAMYAEKSGDSFSGNYNDLFNQPTLFSGTWGDLTGMPTFATVATSGSYNDLLDKPILFDGSWSNLTGKPTTLTGYGITDAMSTSHVANGITSTNITNWNTAYGWGNHATAGYLTSFAEQDTMLWKKNGNDLFYNSGNVGIGTTSPNANVVINAVSGNTVFGITNSTLGTQHIQQYMIPSGAGLAYLVYKNQFHIGTSGVLAGSIIDRFVLDSSGNVGIGTITPVSPIDVRKSASGEFVASFWNFASDGYGLYSRGGGTSTVNTIFYFENYSGSASKTMMMNGDGYVGIGTNTPGYKLDVAGTMNAQEIRVNGVVLNPGTGSNWSVSGSDIYRLSGNVGIGTAAPTSNLHITGNGAYIKLEDTRTGNGAKTYSMGTSRVAYGDFAIIDESISATTARLYIQSGGNVGIGTITPGGNRLNVVGSGNNPAVHINSPNYATSLELANSGLVNTPMVQMGVDSVSNGFIQMNSILGSSTSGLYFGTIDTGTLVQAMTILANGNVGIGTTNPSYKLVVNGTNEVLAIDNTEMYKSSMSLRTQGTPRIYLATQASIQGGGADVGAGLYVQGSNNLYFGRNEGTVHMTINNSGFVGIGTTNPTHTLDIKGSGDFRIWNLCTNNESDGFLVKTAYDYQNASYGGMTFLKLGANDYWGTVNSFGYIAVGSEGQANDGNNKMFFSAADNFSKSNGVISGAQMTLTEVGYVGIGTTNPSELLDVAGGIIATTYKERTARQQIYTGWDDFSNGCFAFGWNYSGNRTANLNGTSLTSYIPVKSVRERETIKTIKMEICSGGGTGSVTLALTKKPYNSVTETVITTTDFNLSSGACNVEINLNCNYTIGEGEVLYIQVSTNSPTTVLYLYPLVVDIEH